MAFRERNGTDFIKIARRFAEPFNIPRVDGTAAKSMFKRPLSHALIFVRGTFIHSRAIVRASTRAAYHSETKRDTVLIAVQIDIAVFIR